MHFTCYARSMTKIAKHSFLNLCSEFVLNVANMLIIVQLDTISDFMRIYYKEKLS